MPINEKFFGRVISVADTVHILVPSPDPGVTRVVRTISVAKTSVLKDEDVGVLYDPSGEGFSASTLIAQGLAITTGDEPTADVFLPLDSSASIGVSSSGDNTIFMAWGYDINIG